jgi:hypothetical protein
LPRPNRMETKPPRKRNSSPRASASRLMSKAMLSTRAVTWASHRVPMEVRAWEERMASTLQRMAKLPLLETRRSNGNVLGVQPCA